jgi:hypothetical protein
MSDRPGDPADRDDNFGGKPSHRAGYATDKLSWVEYWARKGATLAAGEGALLCHELDRLRSIQAELILQLADKHGTPDLSRIDP